MVAAGIEGGSRRKCREEWSLRDYFKQVDHWRKVAPPPYISLSAIASAHGAKFGEASSGSLRQRMVEQASPEAAQALIGQLGGDGEVRRYEAPKRGVSV